MRRLHIGPAMSRRFGGYGLSRNALVRFLATLRFDIENNYQHYHMRRHPEDPRYFTYYLAIADATITHRFYFVIDDSTTPEDLFIANLQHEQGSG